MPIHKLLSGAQFGVDLSIVPVAKELGLQVGGVVPKGYRTKYGNKPKLKEYGFTEHPTSEEYKPRTYLNVKNSDATIRFAYNFDSGGEICTFNAIQKYNKPYIDIDLNEWGNVLIFDVIEFFHKHNVTVLNVAGNAGKNETESRKIFNLVKKLLKNYVQKYNETYPLKDVWNPKDI